MKVLQLTNHLEIGGIATYVLTLSQRLKERGIEVVWGAQPGRLVAELHRSGIPFHPVSFPRKCECHPKMILAVLQLCEIVRHEGVDLIHAHARSAQVAAQLASRLCSVKYVSACHGFFRRRAGRRFFPAWGDGVVAISEPVRNHLIQDLKVPRERVELIHNGVEPKRFCPKLDEVSRAEWKRYLGLETHSLVIGGISRIEKVKGYQYLIRAAGRIIKSHPRVNFLIVGDGQYKRKLMKEALAQRVAQKVVFANGIEDVSLALEVMDIFVQPFVWREAFGLSILEAMAAGKPVVASNCGASSTLIQEGVNGFLVPPRDEAALSEALLKLVVQPQMCRQMGERGREIAQSRFTLGEMADRMIAFYQKVLTGE